MPRSQWSLTALEDLPADANQAHEATVFTASNGYFATRGTRPDNAAGHPATPIAGVYTNDALGFRTLVNAADWLGIRLRLGRGASSAPSRKLWWYQAAQDLRRGVVQAAGVHKVAKVFIQTSHFASLAAPHMGAQRFEIRNQQSRPCIVELTATIRTDVLTRGAKLLTQVGATQTADGATLETRTRGGEYQLAVHGAIRCSPRATVVCTARRGVVQWRIRTRLAPRGKFILDKFVAFATSRDTDGEPAAVAQAACVAAARRGFDAELRRHSAAWARVWRDANIQIEGDDDADLALRYVTAQLLAHAPKNDDRVSLAAKPLSAEGYRGHVFWDTDLFMAPAITALFPDWGRRLANYRYETLPGARRNAAAHGYRGAWYPWESAEDGTEVTPRFWVRSDGKHMPITCWKYEIHSVCDVACAMWDYYVATGDRDWLFSRGLEVMLETARFWASRATWNPRRARYEIHDVCGPDEVHERENNSAYINVLAAFTTRKALDLLSVMKRERPRAHRALLERLNLSRVELAALARLAAKMYIPRDPRTGWYRQFDGFEQRRFVDPQTGLERFPSLAAGARTQIVKQADVIMLLYLLRDRHTLRQILANWDYYLPRTQHNTSLSAATHAAVAARLGLPRTSLKFFRECVQTDLHNRRGDSERGLHGAALGGALCAVLFGFGGLQFHADRLSVAPFLPEGWTRLRIPFVYHRRKLLLDITSTGFTLAFRAQGTPITIEADGQRRLLRHGQTFRGQLRPALAD